jgi:GNAT superfamily N-acetyltransferase
MLATTHELESGLRVRLRLTKPSDAGRLRSFLRRVSGMSLRLRFGIDDPEAVDHRDLSFYDPRERLVVAAAAEDDRGAGEQIVGIADVTLLETGLAEIGLLVDDAHQTKGIGRLMTEAIALMAIQRGATHLKAPLDGDNPAVVRLIERIGPTVKVVDDAGVAAFTRLPSVRGRNAA